MSLLGGKPFLAALPVSRRTSLEGLGQRLVLKVNLTWKDISDTCHLLPIDCLQGTTGDIEVYILHLQVLPMRRGDL